MISALGSPPFPHLRCPIGWLAFLTSLSVFIYIKISKEFNPNYIFHQYDITFKNSNINNIKEV